MQDLDQDLSVEKQIDDMRVSRVLYRIPLTDVALASRIPRWRVQQIFARTFAKPTPDELYRLEKALSKLASIARARQSALDEVRHEANAETP